MHARKAHVHVCKVRACMQGAEGIYWATGSFLRIPFRRGAWELIRKPRPGRHQEQANEQRCTFRPTTFSSVQFSRAYRDDLPAHGQWCTFTL